MAVFLIDFGNKPYDQNVESSRLSLSLSKKCLPHIPQLDEHISQVCGSVGFGDCSCAEWCCVYWQASVWHWAGGDAALVCPFVPLKHIRLLEGWSLPHCKRLLEIDPNTMDNLISAQILYTCFHKGYRTVWILEPGVLDWRWNFFLWGSMLEIKWRTARGPLFDHFHTYSLESKQNW